MDRNLAREAADLSLNKGGAEFKVGNLDRALKYVQRGLDTQEAQTRTATLAGLYELQARINEALGDYDLAIASADQCLKLVTAASNDALYSHCILSQVSSLRRMQAYTQSKEYLVRLSHLRDKSSDLALQSRYYLVSGALKQDSKKVAEARSDFISSLNSAMESGDTFQQGQALNNIGGTYYIAAEYGEASRFYRQALKLRQTIGDRVGQASTLGNQCSLSIRLGELGRARNLCEQSTKLARKAGAKTQLASGLNTLGAIYRMQKNPDLANAFYLKSAKIKREQGDLAGLARTLNNIGEVFLSNNNLDRASEYFEQSLDIKTEINDVSGQGETWGNIGLARENSGDYHGALSAYIHSLVANTNSANREGLWRNFANISQLHDQLDNPDAAIYFGKLAVNHIQKIRDGLVGLEAVQRKSFVLGKRQVYEALADLLIDEGRLDEARYTLNMLKEEEFEDYIQRSSPSDAERSEQVYSTVENEQIERYSNFSRQMLEKYLQYRGLKVRERNTLSLEDELLLAELKAELNQAEAEFESFLDSITVQLGQSAAHTNVVEDNDLNKLNSLQATLRELYPRAAFLHFLVREDKLRIIVSYADPFLKPIYHDSEISETALNRLVFDFLGALQNTTADPVQEAQALYNAVMQPVRQDLDDLGVELLVLHLDEALRYVPLSALHDGKSYLAERFKMVVYTSQAESKLAFPPKEKWRIAGLGVSKRVRDGFEPLPGVDRELNEIIKEETKIDDFGILSGQIFLNEAFSGDRLQQILSDEEDTYQIIHIASHYQFNPVGDHESFLLTGTGEVLSLQTLASGDFYMGAVDLFVLSACETARTTEERNGAEVEGLANSLLKNGAKSVMASLWKVADESTAAFMQGFYREHESADISKVAALQSVQQQFIWREIESEFETNEVNGDRGAFSVDNVENFPVSRGYSHPYYWAPFVLMGNFL